MPTLALRRRTLSSTLAVLLGATAFVSGCPKPSSTTVKPGAYCSPEGATGETSSGSPMRCIGHPGDDRPRWRTPMSAMTITFRDTHDRPGSPQ